MNHRIFQIGLFCWGASVVVFSGQIQISDSQQEVLSTLGKPQGKMRMGDEEAWFYEGGTVQFRDGMVVTQNLMTAAQVRQTRLNEERKRREAEAAREELKEKGEIEKEKKLADPAYTNMTPQQVVEYWDNFKKQYPEVPVDDATYQASISKIQTEAAQQPTVQKEEEKPPKPYVSSKKKKKMMRAGTWVWD